MWYERDFCLRKALRAQNMQILMQQAPSLSEGLQAVSIASSYHKVLAYKSSSTRSVSGLDMVSKGQWIYSRRRQVECHSLDR